MNQFTAKQKLFHNLQADVYARLGVSKIQGIGVMAIRPIPKGINPFKSVDDQCQNDQLVHLSTDDIKELNPRVRKLLKDFFFKHPVTGQYGVHAKGLNAMDISFYMNHSDNPNIELVSVPGCPFYEFRTRRKIKSNEELTFDYRGSNGLGRQSH